MFSEELNNKNYDLYMEKVFMKWRFILSLVFLPAALMLLNGCGSGEAENNQSLEEIRSEQGVPVEIEVVKLRSFEKYLSYFSKLAGIKEATKGAMVGGKIQKIRNRIGDHVNEGAIVVEFPTDVPSMQYEQAKTAYENAKRNYERMKALLAAGETSQSNYDAVEMQYIVAKRNFESVKQVLFIDAPFSGTIIDIKVNEGDYVKNEAYLFTVAQLHKMRAKIWVSEKEISHFKRGMKAVADIGGKEYTGTVAEISMAIDPYKQAFFVEVEFDNSKRELRSGVTADIKVLVYSNPKAIVIQRNLISSDTQGNFVYLEKDNTAHKRYLSTGQESGIDIEVLSGLQEGDRLIISGAAQLEDGIKVNVIK